MGRIPSDWDITTSAEPMQIKARFPRTYDTGIAHGTVTVIVSGAPYEITTYRVDGEYLDGRHPESVSFTKSLEEDLARRDFTMNAIAYHPEEGIVDPFFGEKDIRMKTIRAVGSPDKRFSEDALRILRAARFSGQLGFLIEDETLRSMEKNAPRLRNISVERIRDEFTKLLLSPFPEKLLIAGGFLEYAWDESTRPSLKELELAAERLKLCPKKPALAYALLFCGRNAEGSASSASNAMKFLKFDAASISKCSQLVKWSKAPIPCSNYELRKFLSLSLPGNFLDIVSIRGILGSEAEKASLPSTVELYEKIIKRGDALSRKDLKVNGTDALNCGISGKAIGDALSFLLERVLEEPRLNDREALLCMLSSFQAHPKPLKS
jgi:tRNA nucleotidyltransferase (CCA-adding enzyme)